MTKKILSWNANILFLLIFAGQYFYIYFVTSAKLPPFLGGYFSIACLFSLVVFSCHYFFLGTIKNLSRSDFIFWILPFLLFLLMVLIQLWLGSIYAAPGRDGAAYQSLNLLLYAFVLFVVGCCLSFSGRETLKLGKIVFFIMMFVLLSYVISTGSLFYNVGYVAKEAGLEESFGTYQTMARSVMLVGLIALIGITSPVLKVLWLGLLLFGLFVIGARTELYTFFAIIPLYVVLTMFNTEVSSAGKLIFLGLVILAVIFISLMLLLAQTSFDFNMRQFAIFSLNSDASWSSRLRLDDANTQFIVNNPIAGSHGSHFLQGGAGAYIHNWTSVWQNYGLFAFLLYVYMTAVPLIYLFFLYFVRNYRNEFVVIGICIALIVLISVSMSKSFNWEVTYFSWGLVTGLLLKRLTELRVSKATEVI
ncbi:hypothetical protein ACBQ16_06830 [Halopseudomonas bauzanensis]|uniref:hypothetical protein n=1 Tax=Halopseudomonas bauzanensis TaxID=653930 RepID=UPI00352453C1